MSVTAFWPRSRRRLAARTVALSLRCRSLEDALARVTRERDAARADACAWRADPDAAHRLLHEQAAILAAQQRELDGLHATIARLRPRLTKGD